MASALTIATVTTVLQDVLLNALLRAPVDERVDAAEVMTLYPGSEPLVAGNKPRVNIYLYQAAPNSPLIEGEGFGAQSAAGDSKPQMFNQGSSRTERLALNLYYLLSFYGNEDACEPQRLLGLTMRSLTTNAILSPLIIDRALRNVAVVKASNKRFLAGSDLSRAAESIRLKPVPMSFQEMASLWSVFQTKYTLSIAYQCSVIFAESGAASG
jgi:Pvc16 N-terminal domain